MKRNIELLTQVRDLVKAEPAKLDMGLWASIDHSLVEFSGRDYGKVSCATTACIAGWTVQINGDQLVVYGKDANVYDCVGKNHRVMDIEDRARKLLGLSFDEACELFSCQENEAVSFLDTLIAGGSNMPDDDDEGDGWYY